MSEEAYQAITEERKKQLHAVAVMALDAIVEAVPLSGDMGVGSGIIYAHLSAMGMSLDIYNKMILILVEQGRITNTNHRLQVVKKGESS